MFSYNFPTKRIHIPIPPSTRPALPIIPLILFLQSVLLCFYIIMRDTSRNVGVKKKIQNNHILEELHKSYRKNIEELHNYYYYNTEELHFFSEAGYVF